MKIPLLLKSNFVLKTFISALLLLIYIFVLPPGPLLPHSDTELYLQVADTIRTGNIFSLKPSFASLIRTPGYPVLLALFGVTSSNYEVAVPMLHFFLGILCLGGIVFVLSTPIEILLGSIASFGVLFAQRIYAHFAITEWSATVFLILFCAVLYRFYQSRGVLWLLWLSFFTALLILIRPVLIIGLLPLAIALLSAKDSWSKKFLALIAGLTPLILWLIFNAVRIGYPTLATFGGMSFFGVASQIGAPEVREEDSQLFKDFVAYVKDNKRPVSGEESQYLENIADIYQPQLYNHNLYRVALPWIENKYLSAEEANSLMGLYATRTISSNFGRYIKYVSVGIWYGLKGSWILLLGLIGVLALRTRIAPPIFFTAILTAIFHLSHIFMCAAIQVLVYRYLNLTLYPALGCVALSLLSVVNRGQKANLPA